jgi:putative serine/threonine protein kinase
LRIGETISLDRLVEAKYANVICYPKYDRKELLNRIEELNYLGVKALEFVGEKTVFNVPVLGKGCVGIVVGARLDSARVALKILRLDADRSGMQREAEMLNMANKVEVGPSLVDSTKDFLLMEFVEGLFLTEWIEKLKGKGIRHRIRRVLTDVLEQCWRLDGIGLDHGELSRAPKHIIIDKRDRAHLVDFETASVSRKVSNVTSICQYLFIGSQTSRIILRKLGKIDREILRLALKNYKQNRARENFQIILRLCRLIHTKD